jgi:hypothetical protein
VSQQVPRETPRDPLGVSSWAGYRQRVARKLPTHLAERIRFPEKRTQCWVWTGMTRLGHGYTRVKGADITARRAVYLALRGEPGGPLHPALCGLHTCVNPAHMTIGGRGRRAV